MPYETHGDDDSLPHFDTSDLPKDYKDVDNSEQQELVQNQAQSLKGHEPLTAGSVSGLSVAHRVHARDIVVAGCRLLMKNPKALHYTMGTQRWQGIEKKLKVTRHQAITQGDCSSTATWLLWNALYLPYGVRDVVNGLSWRYGYTGTMLKNGTKVTDEASVRIGDLVFYGSGPPAKHVAICIGGGRVFSHGNEAGPFILPIRYRRDFMGIKRYI